MDIRWLEDLLALSETRNFRKAAERRYITQSGLSRRLQSLERWAAVPLIDREASPVALTGDGKALALVAADVVLRLQQQRRAFAKTSHGDGRCLNLAATGLLSLGFLPGWLPWVEETLGDISLTVLSGHLPHCFALLENGKADLLICLLDRNGVLAGRLQPPLPFGTEHAIVIGEDVLVPLSSTDQLGQPRHRVDVGSALEYVGYVPECALGWAVDDFLARRNIRVRRRRANSLSDGVRAMALAGIGVAWLPQSGTQHERSAGILVRAGDPSFDIRLDIVAVRPRRPLARPAEIVWRLLAQEAEAKDRDDIRPAARGGRHAGCAAAAVGAGASAAARR